MHLSVSIVYYINRLYTQVGMSLGIGTGGILKKTRLNDNITMTFIHEQLCT